MLRYLQTHDKARWAVAAGIGLLVGIVSWFALNGDKAGATTTPNEPTYASCPNLSGWNVNPDELDRKPEPTVKGLKFLGKDLIHKSTVLALADLKPGSYTVAAGSPSPDQDSFFSVEVVNSDGTGYATLRWNKVTSKWNMVTGGQFYEDADPVTLTHKTTPAKGQKVVSFGVGYTANPPGSASTVISSVTFQGQTYPLTCYPASPSTSASPSKTATASPSVSASASRSHSGPASSAPAGTSSPSASAPASLPVTGPGVGGYAAAGGGLLAAGIGLVYVLRKRRVRFEA